MKYLVFLKVGKKEQGVYLETIDAANFVEANKYAKTKNAVAEAATKFLVSFDLKHPELLKLKNNQEYLQALKKLV